MDFIDIVMEARKKKSKKKEEDTSTETDDDLPEDDGEPEDLTVDDEENDEDVSVDDDDLPEDDGEPEDLTADNDDTVESETEEELTDEPADDLPEDDGEPEDLTADGEGTETDENDLPPEDGEPDDLTADDGGDVGGDESTDSGDTMATDEAEVSDPIAQKNEARNRRLLQEDYVDLYFRTKDFLLKLTSLDKSDMILNQVVVQIDKNLNRLKTALWDYTVYEYDKNEYVANLFRYNEFIEVFKVNLDMLTQAKQFILSQREENEKQVKKTKKS